MSVQYRIFQTKFRPAKKEEKKNISIALDYKSQQCPLAAVSVTITNI